MSAAMVFLSGTQERVRNSRVKRAVGVRAIEALLYLKNILERDLKMHKSE